MIRIVYHEFHLILQYTLKFYKNIVKFDEILEEGPQSTVHVDRGHMSAPDLTSEVADNPFASVTIKYKPPIAGFPLSRQNRYIYIYISLSSPYGEISKLQLWRKKQIVEGDLSV